MIGWLIKNALHIRSSAISRDTPRQLAWGLALGVLLGLVPKGNLCAVVISTFILATRVNFATGMLSAAVFSLLGPFADPLTQPIGQALLGHNRLEPLWVYLYDLPLVPWTAFNNTAVMGNLVLGLAMLYPSYRLSLRWFRRTRFPTEKQPRNETVAQPEELHSSR